ncbi:MAG: 2-C-methyl-D-erythritol 2,4-cyclodiphosphate synthase [Nitrospirae bacterium]|nr:MAG: 2-C-methyl-D-erythritol 2,4-cyclodiphosphate synthase [Bacteroidota bacterium]TAN40029.1 MAG: 2-C-methyl-D-erythritol 2,4-cyclodiphosphate synthase [Nitrospirota bacterium]
MKIRVGFGYDVHALQEGKDFWLGGVKIDHTHGAVGHSDADTLIHAMCDAFLGAANLGDIGIHFPNTSEEFRGIDSKKLLKKVSEMLKKEGYEISNVDCTVTLESPKIVSYIPEMKKILTEVLRIPLKNISIKATTTEKLGFVGRAEGVCAYAICLLMGY